VLAFDEGRFGRHTWCRRRWCPRGKRPPWIVEQVFEWIWDYVVVDPLTGRCWSLLLPSVQGEALQVFLDYLHGIFGDLRVGIVLDNAPSHRSHQVHWPEGLEPLYLPPYSPELDPTEQVFRRFRGALSNRLFASQDDLEEAVIHELERLWDDPPALQQLTAYPWWRDACSAILS
jgi:DDE superfamily endonuclease